MQLIKGHFTRAEQQWRRDRFRFSESTLASREVRTNDDSADEDSILLHGNWPNRRLLFISGPWRWFVRKIALATGSFISNQNDTCFQWVIGRCKQPERFKDCLPAVSCAGEI